MNHWISTTIDQIETADLPAPVYRTARRLLDLDQAGTGVIKLSTISMLDIAGTASTGTMRRHLWALAKAGIIHYSINGAVHVSFCAAPVITECAPTRAERAQPDPVITECAPTRAERAPVITQRASSSSLSVSLSSQEKKETETKTAGARRQTDPAYAAVCRKWEQEGFGLITPMVEKQLAGALDQYPQDWIAQAMDRAVARGKRHWSYTMGILRNWQREGYNGEGAHVPARPSTATAAATAAPSPVVPPDDYQPDIPVNIEDWLNDPASIGF